MRLIFFLTVLLSLISPAFGQALKVGDVLSISVLQDPKLDRQVVVDPSGQIAFPIAGRMRALGSTPSAVENWLKQRLKGSYRDELDVTVALTVSAKPEQDDELKPRVYITGEIKNPGSFVVRKRTTLLQGIALAGGFGPFAATRRIQVRRKMNGAEVTLMFDYKAFESGDSVMGNIDLRANDVIIVPERGIFD